MSFVVFRCSEGIFGEVWKTCVDMEFSTEEAAKEFAEREERCDAIGVWFEVDEEVN